MEWSNLLLVPYIDIFKKVNEAEELVKEKHPDYDIDLVTDLAFGLVYRTIKKRLLRDTHEYVLRKNKDNTYTWERIDID